MSKALKRELIWIAVGIVLLVMVIYLLTGTYNPFGSSAVDINIHDTYFVTTSSQFSVFLISFIFFDIYLIRALIARFKNKTINSLFLLFNSLMILTMAHLLSLWHSLSEFGGRTVYPPLSNLDEADMEPNFFGQFYFIPILFLIALIIVQTVFAIKIGKSNN
ncbi:MAG: hypothetical protein KDC51_09100 [Flavobacteriaceae bacterium]|nr:hypothetical protein [Mangrovimonas sp.]MCB0470672.1 hypothetical protein [Flavobacteriaceae bacterium]HPF95933.1 hypothetical protein [Mangrovimonas sp.]HRV56221.1 hypothetical protein [Mangrovimonas sp.]